MPIDTPKVRYICILISIVAVRTAFAVVVIVIFVISQKVSHCNYLLSACYRSKMCLSEPPLNTQHQILLLHGLIRHGEQRDILQPSFLRETKLVKRAYLLSLVLRHVLNVLNPGLDVLFQKHLNLEKNIMM
jgi:hypothetical protein